MRIAHIITAAVRPILHLRLMDENVLVGKKMFSIWSDMVANLPMEEFEKEGVHVIRVGGRLDKTSAPLLERKLQPIVETPGAKIVVDFKNLNYLSSAGLRVMLAAHNSLKKSRGAIVFSSPQEHVKEIINMAGFNNILHFYESETLALKAMKSSQEQG